LAYISQSSIQEVTDRLDSITVMSEYVHLEKKSGRWWACCPFHQEKTASFTVNPDMKTYYCFGCHKGGTVINFIMEMEKITFPETVELLAKKFSVNLIYENSGGSAYQAGDEAKKKQRDDLFELYDRISGTFHHFMLKKPEAEDIKRYIISRGISIEMIESFRLGYAPADRYWLYKFLSKKGYSRDFLASSGLFSARHPEISLFSGRLMFPIRDRQGRTVAFGGRIMPGQLAADGNREPPKYINSPELGIYKKGETLFALDSALPGIRNTKTAYIAEGYLDVIALHQAGITNSLAPLGTAFTGEQAKLLHRWADRVILFFDSDDAGQAAAIKAILTCRKNGLSSSVVRLENPEIMDNSRGESPAPKDPADILKYYGPETLQKIAKCSINDFDYLVTRARSLYDISGTGGQKSESIAKAVASLFPYFDLLESEIARDSYMEAAADAFGLRPAVVAEDYRHYVSGGKPAIHKAGIKEETDPQLSGGKTIRTNDELSLLIAVAVNYAFPREERLFTKFRISLEIDEIEDPNAKEIFIALEECIRYSETGMDELLARISSPELKKLILERSMTGEFSINAEKYVADGIKKTREKRLERRQEEIIERLRFLKKKAAGIHATHDSSAAEQSTPDETELETRELLAEKMKVDNELNQLKQGR